MYILGFLGACFLTVALIRGFYPAAIRMGWVDTGDGVKKLHTGQVPLIGGLAIILGLLASVWIVHFIIPLRFAGGSTYLLCVFILSVVGVVDDFWQRISPVSRTLVQIAVALIAAWSAGEVLKELGPLWGLAIVHTGSWAIPFTVLAFVGVTNSFNLIDGVDGLAGLVALAPFFWITLFAFETGRSSLVWTGFLLAGALVAFLAFNFDHASRQRRIFLGSVGSTFIGFTLAWILIHLSQAHQAPLSPIAAVWIMGFPILETVNVMARRLVRLRHPLYGGRDHFHHFWLHAGASNRQIAIGETLVAWGLGGIGFWGWVEHSPDAWLSWGFIGLALAYFVGFELLELKWKWTKFPDRFLWSRNSKQQEVDQ
ncbi:MAG: MraY family glycosyltransferase [Gammaproteobacteria bacterium]